jgi:hypothetical protein
LANGARPGVGGGGRHGGGGGTEVQVPRDEHAAAAVHREVPTLVRASPVKASPSHGRDLPRFMPQPDRPSPF